MPDQLHDHLRREAAAESRPATEIVREALADWLRQRERRRLADEIERYAFQHAGTAFDLDEELAAEAVGHLERKVGT